MMPGEQRDDEVPEAAQVCPICGGPLVEIHCTARCGRCHAIIDNCCEGIRPVLPKTRDPNGKSGDES